MEKWETPLSERRFFRKHLRSLYIPSSKFQLNLFDVAIVVIPRLCRGSREARQRQQFHLKIIFREKSWENNSSKIVHFLSSLIFLKIVSWLSDFKAETSSFVLSEKGPIYNISQETFFSKNYKVEVAYFVRFRDS